MGPIYLPTWMIDFDGINVGKYTMHGVFGYMFCVHAETFGWDKSLIRRAVSIFPQQLMIGTPHINYIFLLCGFDADWLSTLRKTNKSPENWWLEDEEDDSFSFWGKRPNFQLVSRTSKDTHSLSIESLVNDGILISWLIKTNPHITGIRISSRTYTL